MIALPLQHKNQASCTGSKRAKKQKLHASRMFMQNCANYVSHFTFGCMAHND